MSLMPYMPRAILSAAAHRSSRWVSARSVFVLRWQNKIRKIATFNPRQLQTTSYTLLICICYGGHLPERLYYMLIWPAPAKVEFILLKLVFLFLTKDLIWKAMKHWPSTGLQKYSQSCYRVSRIARESTCCQSLALSWRKDGRRGHERDIPL